MRVTEFIFEVKVYNLAETLAKVKGHCCYIFITTVVTIYRFRHTLTSILF